MDLTVVAQPDKGVPSIKSELAEALAWSDIEEGWLAVAWAKRSGLRLIESELRALRAADVPYKALIGIDQHGATLEGLELALELFSESRIYHDSNPSRTFHPKVYVVKARNRARAIVGSGNLTAGGLVGNYEVSVRLDLDPTSTEDSKVLTDLDDWFAKRWNQKGAAVRLSRQSIKRLIRDPSVVVVPEAWGAPKSASKLKGQKGKAKGVFGPPVSGLAHPPKPPDIAAADAKDAVGAVTNLPIAPTAPPSGPAAKLSQLVLAAGLPKDRWGQAGFNRTVTEQFFGVKVNGDQITAEAVQRNGNILSAEKHSLINPSGSNNNHRIELPEPEGRSHPATGYPIVLARRLATRRVRYLYLMPTDAGYSAIQKEIAKRPPVGISRKPSTKRVYMTLGELQTVYPASPLLKN